MTEETLNKANYLSLKKKQLIKAINLIEKGNIATMQINIDDGASEEFLTQYLAFMIGKDNQSTISTGINKLLKDELERLTSELYAL